jgi:hypothetical protein
LVLQIISKSPRPVMSKTLKWKQFENFVAEIQRELTPEAKIQTNIKRQRRRSGTTRQIDILVEFIVRQFNVSIVIDCEDYKCPVETEKRCWTIS